VIYLTFTLLGYYAEAEVSTSKGRIDVVISTKTHIYILEFKVRDTAQNALQQIKANQYPEKYKDDSRTLVLIGVACQDKKVIEYVVE
jgi:Holliday junction resolvase-like predicted endonuclease